MLFSRKLASPVVSGSIGLGWAHLVLILYFMYLVSSLTFAPVGKIMAGVLLLSGLVALCVQAKPSYSFDQSEFLLLISFALFSLISLVSFLYWPHTRNAQIHLEDYLVFIFLIPLYLLLRHFYFDFKVILMLFSIATILLGLSSIVQYVSFNYSGYQIKFTDNFWSHNPMRPSGGVNPMRHTAVTLVLSVIVFNGLLIIKSKDLWLKVLMGIAFVLGMTGCYLSGSRGSYLAIPFLLIVYCIYLFKSGHRKYLFIFMVSGVFVLAGLSQNERVKRTVASIEMYQSGISNTNLGARFDMFKAALILIEEQPIWGYGLGSYLAEGARLRVDYPNLHPDVGTWTNPHNEVLLVLVEKGVIGLITLFFLFIAPAMLFLRRLSWGGTGVEDSQANFYSMSGLCLLLVYAVVGQSVALFQHDVFNHFFCLMILLFASQVRTIEFHKK